MTTLFQAVESLQADVAALKTAIAAITPSDPTAAIAAAVDPVKAEADATAALVGTPAVPAA